MVEPLDDTKEFIQSVPDFVVSIALVENGTLIVSVLYNPVTGETFTASNGARQSKFCYHKPPSTGHVVLLLLLLTVKSIRKIFSPLFP